MLPARALACTPMARLIFGLVALILGQAWSAPAASSTPDDGSPAALRERYVELEGHLANSPFHQPLTLRSQDTDDRLEGNVYAVIDHPIQVVRNALVSLASTERYALQLHELDIAQYLATKRVQYRRQEARQ